jgi:microcystin-dependent protein
MPLETATYLDDLNAANPAATDQLAQADDHLRLIKSVLQNTFPNITGAVDLTQDEINQGVPAGVIMLWYNTTASIPAGWTLCNGTTQAKADGSGNITSPDLRDRFVVGAGLNYSAFATGGSSLITPTGTVGDHALTQFQIPSHTHGPGSLTISGSGSFSDNYTATTSATVSSAPPLTGSLSVPGSVTTTSNSVSITGTVNGGVTGANSGGNVHGHSWTGTQFDNKPPYYALAYIMKL